MNQTEPSLPSQVYTGTATDFSADPTTSSILPPLSSNLLGRVAVRAQEKMEKLGLRADGNFVTFSENHEMTS